MDLLGREVILDTGGGLNLLGVAGGCGRGLSGKGVHGTQELICDASGLAQPAEQGAVDCGWVISDGVLPSKEETRNRLRAKRGEKKQCSVRLMSDEALKHAERGKVSTLRLKKKKAKNQLCWEQSCYALVKYCGQSGMPLCSGLHTWTHTHIAHTQLCGFFRGVLAYL